MYGFQESAAVGPGKEGGKFGLNTGVVTKFEYNALAGANKTAGDAIDLTVQIGEKEFMKRFFPVGKLFAKKNGGELTDPTSEAYKEAHKEAMEMFNATITDIVLVFVEKADLMAALAHPIADFKAYASLLQRLVQSSPAFIAKAPVDVFLEYQFKPSGENTRTFLQLPKDVKQGTWIVKHQGPGFVEDRTKTHLRYNLGEIQHPFKRGEWFLDSAFANVINLGGSDDTAAPAAGVGAATGGAGW